MLWDWSRRPEPGIKYFSSKTTYRKTFDLSAAASATVADGKSWLFLDMGSVQNIARVRLNGQDLGVVWSDPWRTKITAVVKPTGNVLEIKVANLWPNRVIGDEQEPPDAEYAPH